MTLRNLVLLFAVLGNASALDTPSRWVSYWYSMDNNYKDMIDVVTAHKSAVTSVILDCGHTTDIQGNVTTTNMTADCAAAAAGLLEIPVRVELALGLCNNSILAMRAMFAKPQLLAQQLIDIGKPHNITGWNLDFEPQTPPGTTADAAPYALMLSKMRPLLNAANMRLTIDVADWSPTLHQYKLLAPAVDRLLDMETYNQASWHSWYGYYKNMVNSGASISQVGIGIFPFATKNGTWPSTPASVTQRVSQCAKDDVPEIFVFRIYTESSPEWPWNMWWEPLTNYLNGQVDTDFEAAVY